MRDTKRSMAMNSIEAIINSGMTKVLEETQDLMQAAADQLLSDESGLSAGSYLALMALWRKIDPGAARLSDVESSRCADGRYRLHPDSGQYVGGPDYRVDVTSLTDNN